jgi:soluble lytic murein transglycosylase-like protein
MKQMVYGVFDGDVIYAAAAFGKPTQDAGVWKATLPATRTDVWNSIKTAPERDQIVRFFAAGIVAENPQKFGLKRDRRISELYP